MLRELSSDLPGFKPAHFAPGLNVAVINGADDLPRHVPLAPTDRPVIPGRRGQHATIGYTPLGEQWAREHAGQAETAAPQPPPGPPGLRRSTLVLLLDFMLGGGLNPHRPELAEASGTLQLAASNDTVTARRNGATAGEVIVHASSDAGDPWPIRVAEWQRWLGRAFFDLRGADDPDTGDEPSYRSLISYYVRDADHGGYVDAIRNHAKQPAVETLPPLAHLFGLDPGLVEAAKMLHRSRKHLRAAQRSDIDLPNGQRVSDAAATRELANLTAEIATLELERAEATAAASWRTARAAASGLAADAYAVPAALDQRLVELRARRDALARYADAHAELQRQALELRDSIRSDLRGRHDRLTAASNLYTRYAYDLFGPARPAALTVAAREHGYAFYPVLGGEPAPGLRELTLFCFDLAMTVTARRAGTGPDFLVHDAHLFDRLPTELAAGALDLASRVCAVEDIQYIAVVDAAQLDRIRGYDSLLSYHECVTLT